MYNEQIIKSSVDASASLLKIRGLERLSISDIYIHSKEAFLAIYFRGFQFYRLSGTDYGVVTVIVPEHYDQDEFYNTKEYDESIYNKLEIQWISLKLSDSEGSFGKIVVVSKVLDFNEITNNCPRELICDIPLFLRNAYLSPRNNV